MKNDNNEAPPLRLARARVRQLEELLRLTLAADAAHVEYDINNQIYTATYQFENRPTIVKRVSLTITPAHGVTMH